MTTKVTLSIPDDLAERINLYRDKLNQSAIFAGAVRAEVAKIESDPIMHALYVPKSAHRPRREETKWGHDIVPGARLQLTLVNGARHWFLLAEQDERGLFGYAFPDADPDTEPEYGADTIVHRFYPATSILYAECWGNETEELTE